MSASVDTSDEVLSGEAVAIDVQPVGFLLRALGAIIDMLLGIVLFILWIFVRIWLFDVGILDEATDRIAMVVAIVVSFVVVPIAMEVALKGRSLGKLAVGGRIVRVDGGAAGFRHAFIRALLGVLEIYMTLGGIAVLAGAFNARSQRLGDMVAGTYSQRVQDAEAHSACTGASAVPRRLGAGRRCRTPPRSTRPAHLAVPADRASARAGRPGSRRAGTARRGRTLRLSDASGLGRRRCSWASRCSAASANVERCRTRTDAPRS